MGRNAGGVMNNGLKKQDIQSAIEAYVSGDRMYINRSLRDGVLLNADDKAFVRDLDIATNKPLGKEQILYRSVDAEAIFGKMSDFDYENLVGSIVYGDKSKFAKATADKYLSKIESNKIYTEKGYMSTTKSQQIADEWYGFTGSSKPIVMRIKTPSKTNGVDLSKHRMAQDEVLLKRGQRYKASKVYGKNGNIYVDAIIL